MSAVTLPARGYAFPVRTLILATVLFLIGAGPAMSQDWIAKSNANAQILLEVFASFEPEFAGRMGIPGLDEEILDLTPGFVERGKEAAEQSLATLEENLAAETDPRVQQDIEILIQTVRDNMEGTELSERLELPFFSVTSTVFQGIKVLLDDQVAEERHSAALVRLRRYAGMEEGYEPIAVLAENHIRERMKDTNLLGPVKDEVDKELANSATYIAGLEELFKKYEISGYEEAYARLSEQLTAYDDFVRKEIFPRARTDFRLPEELYAYSLKQFGIDMDVDELMSRAQVAFKEIQNQMQIMAPMVAAEKGWNLGDYRDVIRELKKDQIHGEAILAHYQERSKDLERIIRDNGILTLPDREMLIRLASEAESAAIPAPHMQPPRMIGNTGEMGTFVLPLRVPGKPGEEKLDFDDFNFAAASWTLTAHEGRPGHELQFSSMVEGGVTLARGMFAMTSVNVEGWALYAEAESQPYEPLDGQLIALQHRLLRAARAFLDPGLQTGVITKEEATRVLREDVVLSQAMTMQEVERYTFWAPGQAPSYFVGYNRLLEIRAIAERTLGANFNRTAFNDFILSQGAIPPNLLRKAVMEEFIPRYQKS